MNKQQEIDKILASNSAFQANLGMDSTKEEKEEAREFWQECLCEIASIDHNRALVLSGNDDIDLEQEIKNLIKTKNRARSEQRVEALCTKIFAILKRSSKILSIETIIESLYQIGHTTNLVSDGNGNYALTWDGVFQAVNEPSDLHINIFIKESQWQPSIRKAVEYYLND